MEMLNTTQTRQKLLDSISYYEDRIALWERVTIEKKKDGAEFAQVGRAVRNATYRHKNYGYLLYENELHAFGRGKNGKWVDDDLDCFGYADELPDTDARKEEYLHNNGCCRGTYPLTPDEIRAAIKNRIEKYNQWLLEAENALAFYDANVDTFLALLAPVSEFFANMPNSASLRYALMDYITENKYQLFNNR